MINNIIENINKNLQYINIAVSEKSINQFVLDCLQNNFKKCNSTLNKINDSLQNDLISNNSINVLLLDDIVELNKQLSQLSNTIVYFLGENAKEIVAIKQLKRDTNLLKATIKTLGFSGEMLEEIEA